MSFNLSIPRQSGSALELEVSAGEVVFLLGANGTGKSSLMFHFHRAHHQSALRIAAHRQTWLHSNAIALSPQNKQNIENTIRSQDTLPTSRWKDDYAHHRPEMAIYDLIELQNARARAFMDAFYNDDKDLMKELGRDNAPITRINQLLNLANIPIEIRIERNAEVVATKSGGTPYSVAELSDGERNAILIAASVLTANPGTLLLIDEPERHLHRSIISPLLTSLFAMRPDCAFVASTHDIMLPLDNPSAQTLLIRGCIYNGFSVTWDADIVSPDVQLDDELKTDILGARRKILFVEGTENSLDKPLYSLLFPNVSIIAKGSCRDIRRAVFSIRDAAGLHWLEAFGLVDNDRRAEVEIEDLKKNGIYTTPVFSVEGIYYHPEIQQRLAERHAKITGDDPKKCIDEAKSAAIAQIGGRVELLCQRVAEKRVREEFFFHTPNRKHMVSGVPFIISIDVPKIVASEQERLQQTLSDEDLKSLISQYPVHETPAPDHIARILGFKNRIQYQRAVLKLLIDEPEVLKRVRSLFGALATHLGVDSPDPNKTDAPTAMVA